MTEPGFERPSTAALRKPPPAGWVGLAVLLLYIDHVTGPTVQLQSTYIVPVALAAWFGSRSIALGLAGAMPLVRMSFDAWALWDPRPALPASAAGAAAHAAVLVTAALLAARVAYRVRRAAETVDLLEGMLPAEPRHRQMEVLDGTAERQGRLARAEAFDHAGDLCIEMGSNQRALAFFGRALNAFLETRDVEHATAMCRKILAHSPDAVRARATLALLSLATASPEQSEARIEDYVQAARQVGQEELAVNRLHVIAEATDDRRLRARIAAHLEALGDRAGSARILHQLAGAIDPSELPPPLDDEERWRRLLRAALMGPQELMRLAQPAAGDEIEAWSGSSFRE